DINFTFRTLYVLAIFMIIDGHIGSFDYLSFNGLFPYQNYHIALFIFASGYFFKADRGYGEFIKHKTIKLILPLYLWNFIYGTLVFYLNKYENFTLGGEFSFYNLLYAPLVDGHQYIYNMGAWFLIPLFSVQLISFIILKPFLSSSKSFFTFCIWLFFIVSCFLGVAAIWAASNNTGQRDLILAGIRIFYFLPFYALGILYRYHLEKYDKINTIAYLSIIFVATILLRINFPQCDIIPAWFNYINAPAIVIYLIAILAIFFWLRISKLLTPIIKNSAVLNYISTHTFDIMMHHFVGLMLVKAALSPLGDFQATAFKGNIWYYHFPYEESLLTPIYISISIVIALFIGFTSKKLCYIIVNNLRQIVKKNVSLTYLTGRTIQ
ncbi:MAG: acyltransferase, partial [Acetobacter sp.]|nr:acyltransferase [Acetobacter sp.]